MDTNLQTIKNSPLISIGLPVYNGQKYLREALDSLLNQTYKNFEILISDNCSTDSTAKICLEYVALDGRIKYHRQNKNLGPTKNFLYVLSEARGKYFMWAACDDTWDCEFINETRKVLDEDSSVGLVFTGMVIKDLLTDAQSRYMTGFCTSKRKFLRYIFRIIQCNSNIIYGLHRTEVLRSIGFLEFDYSDVYLIRNYELESTVKIIPRYLFTTGAEGQRRAYSVTGKSISSKKFLFEEFKLLRRNFGFISSTMLLMISAAHQLYRQPRRSSQT